MSSEKLRKYLVYYQKVLSAEPENIEARLRLAAIFRELGRESHAVEEYVTASKLLAKEGLPLEAIAACKAVLELEPEHVEIKYFLARLFALVPDAMGTSSRVAKPLDSMVLRQTPAAGRPGVVEPIELNDPKEVPAASEHDKPTRNAVWPEEGLASEPTSPLDEDDFASPLAAEGRDREETIELSSSDLLDTSTRPVRQLRRPDDAGIAKPTFETFEVTVFDMESLGLDESSEIDVSFLDEFEGEVGEFVAEEVSETYPAIYRVNREELPEIPLLSRLPPDVFMRLIGVIDLQRVPAGTTILQPNHSSRTLFIVVRGLARVTRQIDDKEVELATMGVGEFFGEFVLLTGRSGLATVHARTDCELLAIHESVVNDIADEHPEIWDVLWDFYYARMLNNLLASSDIFRPLDGSTRRLIAERFQLKEVVADEVFLEEGDPCRDLYLLLSGEISAERRISGGVQQLAAMREGEFFGVASSLNEEPYLADLRAVRDSTLLLLPAKEFRAITDSHSEVLKAVELAISSRRALNPMFTSGITSYAEDGVTKFD